MLPGPSLRGEEIGRSASSCGGFFSGLGACSVRKWLESTRDVFEAIAQRLHCHRHVAMRISKTNRAEAAVGRRLFPIESAWSRGDNSQHRPTVVLRVARRADARVCLHNSEQLGLNRRKQSRPLSSRNKVPCSLQRRRPSCLLGVVNAAARMAEQFALAQISGIAAQFTARTAARAPAHEWRGALVDFSGSALPPVISTGTISYRDLRGLLSSAVMFSDWRQ